MSETLVAPTPEVQETGRNQMVIQPDQLAGSMFGVTTPTETGQPQQVAPTQEQPAPAAVQPPAQTEQPKEDVEIIDEDDFYKREFGKDKTAWRTEYDELMKFKNEKPKEFEWANEDSKKVHELLRQGKIKDVVDIYTKQEQLDKFINAEINNQSADGILKLQMKLKYPTLTDNQIDFQFRQDYGVPKEPVYNDMKETEDEFNERHELWKEQVSNIEMKKTIAATMALPELKNLKTQIVLPEIFPTQVQEKPPTQEELEAAKKYEEAYHQSVDNSLKEFGGFTVKVKNDEVGLPETTVSYNVIDGEKTSLSQLMKDFSKVNYDANSLFAPRWVNEGGVLNTKQMIEDKYLLDNKEKIFQKIADESATKAIEAYIKGKKNITVTETGKPVTVLAKDDKTEYDNIRDNFFGKTA